MRLLVRAAPTEHLGWLQARTGCALTSDFNAIQAMDDSGRIHGMVGYCGWTKNSVQMHVAIQNPIVTRALVRPSFEYPFRQVGVNIALAVIRAGNQRSLKFSRALGFSEMCRVRDGFAIGEDLVMLELRQENCRFLIQDERRAA